MTGQPAAQQGAVFRVRGIVQGVGFRPFVHGLATRLGLTGWVRNTSAGVEIVVDGSAGALDAFAQALVAEAPAVSRIEGLERDNQPANGYNAFTIRPSLAQPNGQQPISPDLAICADCQRELFDPADRRYRYPFINCTYCGPRFTIIRALPYDRPATTMAGFELCPACAAEYADPANRRFHAQPIACPACGPHVWLETGTAGTGPKGEPAIQAARQLLQAGGIVAVKGLGGFHLACDAANPAAVRELRRRKRRGDKPFAVMVPDLAAARACCQVPAAAELSLRSRERPIVVLERQPASPVAAEAAPGQNTLGLMLPYTPLHYLLLEPAEGFPQALVMTSGNPSDEPLTIDNGAARARLAGVADAFLMHDRPIHARCDDSVLRATPARQVIRRARGLAPDGLPLPLSAPPLLATGAELKNTFCLAAGTRAFLSPHIGDLDSYETLTAFEESLAHLEALFRITPEAVACDLHPDALATCYAQARAEREALPLVRVQHHHAHLAACLADNEYAGAEPVLGVIFDGTGYGDDGAIWGGEFLYGGYASFERRWHLAYVPLPGGDLAVREPWRMALSWLAHAGVAWDAALPPVAAASPQALAAVRRQITSGLNAPPTASMGRLFDAVASLAGVRQRVTYEAQAAIELEACVDWGEAGAYAFELQAGVLEPAPVIRAIVADLEAGVGPGQIATRFHRGLAVAVRAVAAQVRAETGTEAVALSGGVWQNQTLQQLALAELTQAGFHVLVHHRVPANDGGLALGQAAVAASRLAAGG